MVTRIKKVTEYTDIQVAIIKFEQADRKRRDANREYDEAAAALKGMMNIGQTIVEDKLIDGATVQVTKTCGTRTVLDEAKLAGLLPPKVWRSLQTLQFSRDKLDQGIASGAVPASTVVACTEQIPNEPYIVITRK